MNPTMKNLMFWMAAALVIFVFWSVSSRIQKNERLLSFSDFMTQLERGHVAHVTFTGYRMVGTFKNGQTFRTYSPPQAGGLIDLLLEKGVVVNVRDPNGSSWLGHLISWTPIAIMIAFLIFFMRQMQSAPAVTRRERRLRAKAKLYEVLTRTAEALSESEMSLHLNTEERSEIRTVLYEMVRDGAVVLTTDRKYRPKTVD